MLRASALTLLLALLAACTQEAASVELKGHQSYSRNGGNGSGSFTNGYNAASGTPFEGGGNGMRGGYVTAEPAPMAPTTHDTTATASISSIGVADLTPPGKGAATPKPAIQASTPAASAPAGSPFMKSPPAASLSPAAGKAAPNPWTGRSREVVLTKPGEKEESFNLRPNSPSVKEETVAEVKEKKAEKTVARLDSIISSDGEEKAKPAITRDKPRAESGSGFIWPVSSKKVVSAFGPKGKGKVNDGINIASPNGEPIWAAADGEVVFASNELKDYGNMVLIKHSGDKTTTYAHMGRIIVDKYERVKQGDIIGYVGSTGKAKDAQLHFAVHEGKNPVDPVKFMKRNVASLQ